MAGRGALDDYVVGGPRRSTLDFVPFTRFPTWMWRNEEVLTLHLSGSIAELIAELAGAHERRHVLDPMEDVKDLARGRQYGKVLRAPEIWPRTCRRRRGCRTSARPSCPEREWRGRGRTTLADLPFRLPSRRPGCPERARTDHARACPESCRREARLRGRDHRVPRGVRQEDQQYIRRVFEKEPKVETGMHHQPRRIGRANREHLRDVPPEKRRDGTPAGTPPSLARIIGPVTGSVWHATHRASRA